MYLPGVSKIREDKWRARIGYRKKRIHLGYFETEEEAFAAYLKARKEYGFSTRKT